MPKRFAMLSSWLMSLQLLSWWDCERSMQYPDLQIVWLVVCLFMQRCCFNCRSTPHCGQNHNLYFLLFIYQGCQKLINFEWVKISMKATIGIPKFSAGLVKRFPHILWNPNVYYNFHYDLPLEPILNHINSVHVLISCSFTIHLNINLPFVPGYSKWPLFFMFLHQNSTHFPLLPHPFLIPRPFLPPWYHRPNNFTRAIKTMTIQIT